MSRADRILARAQAHVLRAIATGIAQAIQSTDSEVRRDALDFAAKIWPPMPSVGDMMRLERGLPTVDDKREES